MDGERSGLPAGHEGGYVPPDLVSTQRFWTIPVREQAAAAAAAEAAAAAAAEAAEAAGVRRGSAESTLGDRRVAPAEEVLDALATHPRANGPMSVPMAAAAPPRLPPRTPAAQPWPPAGPPASASASTFASAPGAAAYGTSGPGDSRPSAPRKPRLSRHMTGAAIAAAGVVIIGAGVAALWPGDGGSPAASGDGASSASAPAKTQRGGPSPTGTTAAAPPAPSGARPLTRGRVVSYVTAQREPGYFEGLLTLTNRTGAPLTAWQVSFTYPGAYVKSVWGGVLVRAGSTATIRGTAATGSIPVGGTVQVKFGAAGTPSAPVGCTLNGGPC